MIPAFFAFLTGILITVNSAGMPWCVLFIPLPFLLLTRLIYKKLPLFNLALLFLFWTGGFLGGYTAAADGDSYKDDAVVLAPLYIEADMEIGGFPDIMAAGKDGALEYIVRAGQYQLVSPYIGGMYPTLKAHIRGWLYPYSNGGGRIYLNDFPGASGDPAVYPSAGFVVTSDGIAPLSLVSAMREWTARQFLRTENPSVRALLFSLLIGNRYFMSYTDTQSFRMSGVLHILALSGMHVGAISLGIVFILKRLMEEKHAYLVSTFLVILYVALGGMSPSLVRSGIMFVTYTLLKGAGRKPDFLDILVFSAFVLLAADPLLIRNIGFVLSYVSTAAIILLNDSFRDRLRLKGYFGNILSGTLAANLTTAPFLFYYFKGASLISPLTNFLIVPYFGLILGLLFLHFFLSLAGVFILEVPIEGIWWGVSAVSDILSRPAFSYIRIGEFGAVPLGLSLAAVCAALNLYPRLRYSRISRKIALSLGALGK
ncbi:MAG: hypothetical protein A2Y33_13510 [Spirochaetes bacterium GWF1_51_8]|nr:MAG: hypothetical protein A2Y33_13510 [Spirochaetes bacterium GWF1_51_8]